MAIFNSHVTNDQRLYPIHIPLNQIKSLLNHYGCGFFNDFPWYFPVIQTVVTVVCGEAILTLINRNRPEAQKQLGIATAKQNKEVKTRWFMKNKKNIYRINISLWNDWFFVKKYPDEWSHGDFTPAGGWETCRNGTVLIGQFFGKILIDRMNQNLGQLRRWVMCFLTYRSIGNPPELRNLCGILFVVGHRFGPMKMRNAGAPSDPQFDH